ncbi:hypothetical protein JYU34_010079 [Plutella xylostella]|uniref:Uncharacterized protein n=1 Tax=Plutella xylostella TaxID=51655 RepID=A0ABQ7QII0_PLUXY|nr:hypothetical protein JYU34_010079 [Plutella xylostella]
MAEITWVLIARFIRRYNTTYVSFQILVLLTVLAATAAAQRPMNMTKPKLYQVTRKPTSFKHKTPEERRKLSFFPKSTFKYIATPKPQAKKLMDRKPMLSLKTTLPVVEATKAPKVINRPLLNARKFAFTTPVTTKLTTTVKPTEAPQLNQNRYKAYESREEERTGEVISGEEDVDQSNEEDYEAQASVIQVNVVKNTLEHKERTNDATKQNKAVVKENKSAPKVNENVLSDNVSVDKNGAKEKSEIEDNEFLIVREKRDEGLIIQFPLTMDTEDDEGVTAEYPEELIVHVISKRNVIEEENLASTVSGFRFTGREPRLNNHLKFNNINA